MAAATDHQRHKSCTRQCSACWIRGRDPLDERLWPVSVKGGMIRNEDGQCDITTIEGPKARVSLHTPGSQAVQATESEQRMAHMCALCHSCDRTLWLGVGAQCDATEEHPVACDTAACPSSSLGYSLSLQRN